VRRAGAIFLGALAVLVAVAAALRPRSDSPGPAAVAAPVAPPGRLAETASVAGALRTRIKRHNTIMIAASLSYYALLSMFPAVIAAVSIYGLVADPAALESQLVDLSSALPESTAAFVGDQLEQIVATSPGSLGVATAISILLALWSASAGTKALISAINHAYGEEETRSFLVLRGAAFAVTIGVIVFGLGSVALVAFLPKVLDAVGLGKAAATTLNILRWPFVLAIVVIGLGGLFKVAPNRSWSMTRWVNTGGVLAAGAWVMATLGLSLYVTSWGGALGETYGALTGVIVLMLWFFLSGVAVLAGAETNALLEGRGDAAADAR